MPIAPIRPLAWELPYAVGTALKKILLLLFELLFLEGVPIVAQWLTNMTRNHEVVGSIPGLAHVA